MSFRSAQRRFRLWTSSAFCFLLTASLFVSAQTFNYQEQIAASEARLAKARAAHNERDEANELLRLGEFQAYDGLAKVALDTENEALAICIRLKLGTHAGIAVQDIGWIYSRLENKKRAVEYYNMALKMEEAESNFSSEAVTLDNLGDLSFSAGQPALASDYYNRALKLERDHRDRFGEARTLRNVGSEQMVLGNFKDALNSFGESLNIYRDLKNFHFQADLYVNLANVYWRMEDSSKAIKNLEIALELRRTTKDRDGEAVVQRQIAYDDLVLGDEAAALRASGEAIRIHRELNYPRGEASDLASLAAAFRQTGQLQRAIDTLKLALDIRHKANYQRAEADTLNSIGYVYTLLGMQSKSLDYWEQARHIDINLGEVGRSAGVTSNMSTALANIGQNEKALSYANQALAVWRDIENPWGEAGTLHTLGWIYENLGQHQKALAYFQQALPIHRLNHQNESLYYTLRGMGQAELALGNVQNALDDDLAALAAAKKCRDPSYIGQVDSTLMQYWRTRNQPQLAILFGVEAVNNFQLLRKNIQGLAQEEQAQFAQSKAQSYRQLAELLVEQDRLVEAEHVLDLLKEEELQEVVRGGPSDAAAKVGPLPLSAGQKKAEAELPVSEDRAFSLVDLTVEYDALLGKNNRSADEVVRLKDLSTRIEAENRAVSSFFKETIFPDLAQKAGTDHANALVAEEKNQLSQLQNTLRQLGPEVLAVRFVLGEQHTFALVVSSDGRARYELDATPAALRDKILAVRNALRSPSSDPRPSLYQLYAMLVSPIDAELKALEKEVGKRHAGSSSPTVPTVVWSLDGSLRYIPMAALYDGHRYMAERFNNVVFTPESYGHIASPNPGDPHFHALAMGISKSYRGMAALPGVIPELQSVVHDPAVPASHGPLEGNLLSDEMFTYGALKARLTTGSTIPVIHIASHFVMQPGDGGEPYLMLGGNEVSAPDGFQLTLSHLEDSPISFQGTRLLTLSACSTAKGDAADNGMEIESLGMIAQRKDAEAVLATLWDVNDASTSQLMRDFYARWIAHPGQGKAEALRQAQLTFMRGSGPSESGADGRGSKFARDNSASAPLPGYSHPFYWAPFVLTGNYQ